jgi:hypothetical protein
MSCCLAVGKEIEVGSTRGRGKLSMAPWRFLKAG